MSNDFWFGILALPASILAAYLALQLCYGIRTLANKAFGALLTRHPGIRDGKTIDAAFPIRTATDFGQRSTFASLALASKTMYLFEPIQGLGVFIFVGKPGTYGPIRRAKAAVEAAYEHLLEGEQKEPSGEET